MNRREQICNEAISHQHSLNDEETLIEPPSHRQDAGQDDDAKHSERRDTRGLLLLANYWNIVLQVLVDPKTTVGGGCKKYPAASPSVNKVELLVSVTGTE